MVIVMMTTVMAIMVGNYRDGDSDDDVGDSSDGDDDYGDGNDEVMTLVIAMMVVMTTVMFMMVAMTVKGILCSQKCQNLNFLHLFVALLQEAHFPQRN